jgi:hypothetical protein
MNWKQRILLWLTAIAGICTVIGGLDLTEILPLLPNPVAAWLTLALPVVVTVGKIVLIIGDLLDDGIRNDSFKGGTWLLLLIAVLACSGLSGCVAALDQHGDWSFRTDPHVVDRVLDHVLVVDDKGSK